MHIIAAVDTEASMHLNFQRWLASREYKPNPTTWNVKVREIKLYDLTFSKAIEDKVLADLKFFDSSCAGSLSQLPQMLMKLNKFLPIVPRTVELVDMSNIKPTPFKDLNLPFNEKSFWANVQILGKLNDTIKENGHECL